MSRHNSPINFVLSPGKDFLGPLPVCPDALDETRAHIIVTHLPRAPRVYPVLLPPLHAYAYFKVHLSTIKWLMRWDGVVYLVVPSRSGLTPWVALRLVKISPTESRNPPGRVFCPLSRREFRSRSEQLIRSFVHEAYRDGDPGGMKSPRYDARESS